MRKLIYFIFGLLLAINSRDAFAEECHIEKQAVLPITFNRFVPTVPVTINGHQVNIGIDTGSEGTAITPEIAAQFSLPKDPKHSTRAVGSGGASIVPNVIMDLEFAGIQYPKISAAVIAVKSKPTASTLRDFGPELPMAGLLGGDFLSNYDVEYDVPGHTLTLYTVTGCEKVTPPWHGKFVGIHASLTKGNRLVIPFGIDHHKLTAVFDTGSNGLRLAKHSISKVGVTEEMLANDSTSEGSGIGEQVYKSPLHQFDSLLIGREIFRNIKIDVVDFSAPDSDALIGEDYMHNRRFWISYATHTLFVQPMAH